MLCVCLCEKESMHVYILCVCAHVHKRETETETERQREKIESTFIPRQVNNKEEFCEPPSSSGIPVKLLYCCFWVGPEKPEQDGSVPHHGQC